MTDTTMNQIANELAEGMATEAIQFLEDNNTDLGTDELFYLRNALVKTATEKLLELYANG